MAYGTVTVYLTEVLSALSLTRIQISLSKLSLGSVFLCISFILSKSFPFKCQQISYRWLWDYIIPDITQIVTGTIASDPMGEKHSSFMIVLIEVPGRAEWSGLATCNIPESVPVAGGSDPLTTGMGHMETQKL